MLVCRWKISYSNVIERRKVAIDNDESCRTVVYFSVSHIKMGKWCFPNKKILRNSPCLPACKQKNIATRLRDTT